VPHELDQILISSSQPDFAESSVHIREAVFKATHFDYSREKQLDNILDQVAKRKDSAVAEYTEKFDGVKLTPEQFRISKEELENAHVEM
jgi:histidinol dehydrogenase